METHKNSEQLYFTDTAKHLPHYPIMTDTYVRIFVEKVAKRWKITRINVWVDLAINVHNKNISIAIEKKIK